MRLRVEFYSHDYPGMASGYDKELTLAPIDRRGVTSSFTFELDYQFECEVIVRPKKKETP